MRGNAPCRAVTWAESNKENLDPHTRRMTTAKPRTALATRSTAAHTVVKPTRRRNAIVPVGSPRSVCDTLANAFTALAVATSSTRR